MKLAIVGSRKYPSLHLVSEFVQKVAKSKPDTVIVSGGAEGVDSVAVATAKEVGLDYQEFLPNRQKYGWFAPLIRNTQIAQNADKMVAFWDLSSRGTLDVLRKAYRLGKPIVVIGPEGSVIPVTSLFPEE